jgi:predicted hydrocarbon binding protein
MGPQMMSSLPWPRPVVGAFSNRFLRHVLLSLRMVAGDEYGRILQEVGLERYCRELPPPTVERMSSAADVAALFQAGYRRLPPPLSLVFFTHMGEQLAQDVWDAPAVQALSGPLLRTPPGERVPAVWRGLAQLAAHQVPVDRYLISDARHHYLIIEQCPYCRTIQGADRPICLVTTRFYEVMFQKLIDRSVVVHEVECAATGHGRCMFAVRRDPGSLPVA